MKNVDWNLPRPWITSDLRFHQVVCTIRPRGCGRAGPPAPIDEIRSLMTWSARSFDHVVRTCIFSCLLIFDPPFKCAPQSTSQPWRYSATAHQHEAGTTRHRHAHRASLSLFILKTKSFEKMNWELLIYVCEIRILLANTEHDIWFFPFCSKPGKAGTGGTKTKCYRNKWFNRQWSEGTGKMQDYVLCRYCCNRWWRRLAMMMMMKKARARAESERRIKNLTGWVLFFFAVHQRIAFL